MYYDFIIKELKAGVCIKDVYRSIIKKGYTGGQTAAYDYMNALIARFHIDVAVLRSSSAETIKKKLNKFIHISRSEIFRFLWMGSKLESKIWSYLEEQYSKLYLLKKCIQDFREIFRKKSMP